MLFIARLIDYLRVDGSSGYGAPEQIADEYRALLPHERLLVIATLAQPDEVRLENAASFLLAFGGLDDLRCFCETTDLWRGDRDYLLDVVQELAIEIESGRCDDPRPLLTKVSNLAKVCDEEWCDVVYRLILDRHPLASILLWQRFLAITADPDRSAEFVRSWECDSSDAYYTDICQEGPFQVLYALRDTGYFEPFADAAKSEWLKSLLGRGSPAALVMTVEVLELIDGTHETLRSIERSTPGLSHCLCTVGNACGDSRLQALGKTLRLLEDRYSAANVSEATVEEAFS